MPQVPPDDLDINLFIKDCHLLHVTQVIERAPYHLHFPLCIFIRQKEPVEETP